MGHLRYQITTIAVHRAPMSLVPLMHLCSTLSTCKQSTRVSLALPVPPQFLNITFFFFLFFPEIFSFKYSLKVALSSPTKPSLWQQAAICSVPKLQGCSMPRVNFATISCEDFLPSSDKMLMSKNVELERA